MFSTITPSTCMLALGALALLTACAPPVPVQVGVLVNVGGYDKDLRPLQWAIDTVNDAGGVQGRPIELVALSSDSNDDLDELVAEMLDDPDVVGVIGPSSTEHLLRAAPRFADAGQVLISPSSTGEEVTRAYGRSPYIWRTTQSDIGQIEVMLLLAKERGIERVALLTSFDSYGSTFFHWFGFLANEIGIEATVERYDPDTVGHCESQTDALLATDPEIFYAAPAGDLRQVSACLGRLRVMRPDLQLFMGDTGFDPDVLAEAGDLAEGVQGLAPASDPDNGFESAFIERFGEAPMPWAANLYDAGLLMSYGLQASGGEGGTELAEALKRVVAVQGEGHGWQEDGVRATLERLDDGDLGAFAGATGSLDYSADVSTEIISTSYQHWTVQDGAFVNVGTYRTGDGAESAISVFETHASEAARQELENVSALDLPDRTGLKVVVAALSTGWSNYRHQADALAVYQTLRDHGVHDDDIVLILQDDLADLTPDGAMPYPPEIADVRAGAKIDYYLDDLDADGVLAIMAGERSPELPVVVDSDETTNLLVFLVGHGGAGGVPVGAATEEQAANGGEGHTFITPDSLAAVMDRMHEAGRYRRALVVVEACHAGVLGETFDAPAALLLTGARSNEQSFASSYDPELEAWLSDQFAQAFVTLAGDGPDTSITKAYQQLYGSVSGSHVSLYNHELSGDLRSVPLSEFVQP